MPLIVTYLYSEAFYVLTSLKTDINILAENFLQLLPEEVSTFSFAFLVLTMAFLADLDMNRFRYILVIWSTPSILTTLAVDIYSWMNRCCTKIHEEESEMESSTEANSAHAGVQKSSSVDSKKPLPRNNSRKMVRNDSRLSRKSNLSLKWYNPFY